MGDGAPDDRTPPGTWGWPHGPTEVEDLFAPRRSALRAPVRRLRRRVSRGCARPGCAAAARATLTFSYPDQRAVIDELGDVPVPEAYDLCEDHADRTTPPRGWAFLDRRRSATRAPARTVPDGSVPDGAGPVNPIVP